MNTSDDTTEEMSTSEKIAYLEIIVEKLRKDMDGASSSRRAALEVLAEGALEEIERLRNGVVPTVH